MARIGHDSEQAAMIYQHEARGADQVFTSGMDWPAVVAAISGGIVGVTGILASWLQSNKTVSAQDERDKRVEKRRVYAQYLATENSFRPGLLCWSG
jgi:hypothetical protein